VIGCHDWSPSGSSDFDRAWLFQFRARYEEREHAIAVLGAYAVRVYLDRNRDRAVEHATDAFTPMDAGIFLVFDLFLASDTYRVFLCFDGQVAFGEAGQFDHQDKVVPLLEDIDGR